MLCVIGSPLYQWDLDRQVQINTVDVNSEFTVHCCHKGDTTTLVVEPIIEGDTILVNIPNILLQRSGIVRVYVSVQRDTVFDTTFYVLARPKPDDYIYTETEVFTVEKAVEKAIEEAIESGDFKGEKGDKGEDGKDGKDGADGKDYVLTDTDKTEIANEVLSSLPTWNGGDY